MKLQYKNNQWEAGEVPEPDSAYPCTNWDQSNCPMRKHGFIYCTCKQYEEKLELALSQFKPIAPNDQERVRKEIAEQNIKFPPINWQPEEGKLYDSGDLEFELKEEMSPRVKINNETEGSVMQQFWVLKAKEQPSKSKEILGCGITKEQETRILKEAQEDALLLVDEHEGTPQFICYKRGAFRERIVANQEIKQLQSRIAELDKKARIEENKSILKMAELHMDERAVFVIKERIKELESKLNELEIDKAKESN